MVWGLQGPVRGQAAEARAGKAFAAAPHQTISSKMLRGLLSSGSPLTTKLVPPHLQNARAKRDLSARSEGRTPADAVCWASHLRCCQGVLTAACQCPGVVCGEW